MEENKRNKSSIEFKLKEHYSTDNCFFLKNSNKSKEVKSKDIKSLYSFIFNKKRIILKSCFDHKGTKKFLLEKKKSNGRNKII